MARPPYDPELAPLIEAWPPTAPLSRENLPEKRKILASIFSLEDILKLGISYEVIEIPGPGGPLPLHIFSASNPSHAGPKPAIYNVHGGGMVMGTTLLGIKDMLVPIIMSHSAIVIAPDYRLAPEHPHPALVEDCFAGLKWVGENLERLGINPKKLMLAGASGGGGVAAGTALLNRDRKGPQLSGLCLTYPQLDDRNSSNSAHQFSSGGSWSREDNIAAWEMVASGSTPIDQYAAPAHAENLGGLPETFIEVGSAEVFRDECVTFASKIWADGGQAELHVWPGTFHGSDLMYKGVQLSKDSKTVREMWISRVFGRE